MNHLWIGIVLGLIVHWGYQHILMKIFLHYYKPGRAKLIRRSLLSKLDFDSLLLFADAVEQELKHRVESKN